ncbi:MAG TPA: isocitrate/isopropylmalate dehydrogenase family protein [Phycisphaerae bacterium]|jgi:isocitrate dehydrogenase (NAD+)|nr:isocitrate/isopropylmalate dehydrogenase family protein [Phycisphaerae bacterium]HOB73824.1 isocitrate/isopropylmalate dehydrogenase family protein [Phycisphaerae bacterium]HOJ53961.1 isocitrate/isopropylmalate dehydrogenase family protein [Phycisphaerae bacterium]HOL27534.1 isocitrate/isopropylmalate dehydrogenase family protein [Phycisphaerae bacterium]HPP22583.1 isocitrate/isopropylmalate dehydrogenase family protein [Phycisphaerae bacterium]
MTHTVCLLPGDGIGPEVTTAARQVIDATGVDIEWVVLPAGSTALEFCGSVLPQRTLAAIAGHGVALKGPVTTPIGGGHTSVNVSLRKKLNLYAAVRPVRSMPGIKTRYDNVELVIIRENTEGLYSGIENEIVPGVVQSLKIATEPACTRIARFAFDYAVSRGRRRVTVLHKANIMKKSDGLFLRCARKVYTDYAGKIEYNELIIDNGCMQIIRDPSQFDVLLLENLYGDIISDLAAGLVGGLGVVPGANFGESCAVFEPVHGSAPDLARKGIANPLACIMSGVMMLNHLGEHEAAARIRDAYNTVLARGNPEELTRDIGGKATTQQFTDAVIKAMGT